MINNHKAVFYKRALILEFIWVLLAFFIYLEMKTLGNVDSVSMVRVEGQVKHIDNNSSSFSLELENDSRTFFSDGWIRDLLNFHIVRSIKKGDEVVVWFNDVNTITSLVNSWTNNKRFTGLKKETGQIVLDINHYREAKKDRRLLEGILYLLFFGVPVLLIILSWFGCFLLWSDYDKYQNIENRIIVGYKLKKSGTDPQE